MNLVSSEQTFSWWPFHKHSYVKCVCVSHFVCMCDSLCACVNVNVHIINEMNRMWQCVCMYVSDCICVHFSPLNEPLIAQPRLVNPYHQALHARLLPPNIPLPNHPIHGCHPPFGVKFCHKPVFHNHPPSTTWTTFINYHPVTGHLLLICPWPPTILTTTQYP